MVHQSADRPHLACRFRTFACVATAVTLSSACQAATVGNVTSWSQSGHQVTFSISDGSRLAIDVLAADLARVRFAPDGVIRDNISRAVVKDDWPVAFFTTSETSGAITITTDELKIEVGKTPCVVNCRDLADNVIVGDDPSRRMQWGSGYTRVYKTTQSGEDYLGLGWRPLPLRRNGTVFWMKNVPTYNDPETFYGGIPLWYGLRNGNAYAIFFDDTSWGDINVGAESSSYMFFHNLGGQVDYYVFYGPAMSKILDRYTELTGRPYLPPKWACGYQQCRWSYTPQTEVLSIANEFRARSIPCDVIYVDIDYMYPAWQLTFDPSTFPDPAAMCATLHAQGFHTVANISPWLAEDDPKQPEAVSNGYLLTEGGSPHRVWHDYIAFVMGAATGWTNWIDFSQTAACNWWGSQHTSFLNYGIDGIWNDLNEPDELNSTWPTTVTYNFDGSPVHHNKTSTQYCLLQTDMSAQILKSHYPSRRPFVLSRGAYAGIQRSASVWSGDNKSDWTNDFKRNIPMGLSMSISGQPHNGHDNGGFFGYPTLDDPPSGELYARWMQAGVFNPFCRQHHDGYGNHGSRPYVEPWRFGATVEDICRDFIGLRYELMPYLYSLFYQAHTTGAPIQRPMVYDFQNDAATINQDYDFMFGPFMLVSPVYTPGATTRSVYLPSGAEWIDWWTDTVYNGGQTVTADAPLERLPIFVRAGAIIPMGPVQQYASQFPVTETTLRVYPSSVLTSFTMFEDDGLSWNYQGGGRALTAFTTWKAGDIFNLDIGQRSGIYTPARQKYLLEIHTWTDPDAVVVVAGDPLTRYTTKSAFDAAPSGSYYDAAADVLYARFADTGLYMAVTAGPSPTETLTSPLLPAGWNLISLPDQPVDTDPASVFAGVPIDGNLVGYNHGAAGYVTYYTGDPLGFGQMSNQIGCWLYLAAPDQFAYEGYYNTTPQTIPLDTAGWYLIGVPTRSATSLTDLQVTRQGTTVGFAEAAYTRQWLAARLYWYDPARKGYATCGLDPWDDFSQVEPWKGYWLCAYADGLTLTVPVG